MSTRTMIFMTILTCATAAVTLPLSVFLTCVAISATSALLRANQGY